MPEIEQDGAMTVIPAEGARVGFVVCQTCGAAILLDPRELFDAKKLHDEWHKALREVDRA